MSAPTPPARLEPGQCLNDRYEITEYLGAGGMAAVYRATDRIIARTVAIKILTQLPHIHDADDYQTTLDRFQREAQLAAQIRHPSAVTIFDMGVMEAGQPFIVMDVVEGWELDDELKENGAMAPARLLPLFCDCLEALAEGHKLGIVHKDIKPSNLMLHKPGSPDERLLILDFGVAALEHHDARRLTQTGAVLGTPQYLPAEYSRDRLITASLDVYQMALTLIEALMDRPVVKENNPMAAMIIQIQGLLEVPDTILQSPLGPILRKALAYKHTDRHTDAQAFLDDLRQIDPDTIHIDLENDRTTRIHQQPDIDLETITGPVNDEPEERPSRRLAGAALLLGGLLILMGGVGIWLMGPGEDPALAEAKPPAPIEAKVPTKTPPKAAPIKTPPEPVEDAAANHIKVQIVTTPKDAQVFLNGQEIEPELVFTGPNEGPVTLEIKARRHKTRTLEVSPDNAPVLNIELASKPRRSHGNKKTRSPIAN